MSKEILVKVVNVGLSGFLNFYKLGPFIYCGERFREVVGLKIVGLGKSVPGLCSLR